MGRGRGIMVEKVQGIKSINGRYKIDRERLRIVWEICTTHGHELRWGNDGGRGVQGGGE